MRIRSVATLIKVLAVLDLIFLVLFAMWNWYFIFGVSLIVAGYVGASRYSPGLVFLYAIYQAAMTASRVALIATDHEKGSIAFQVITAIGLAIQVYIFYLVLRFFFDLLSLSHQDREAYSRGLLVNYAPWGVEPEVGQYRYDQYAQQPPPQPYPAQNPSYGASAYSAPPYYQPNPMANPNIPHTGIAPYQAPYAPPPRFGTPV